MNKHLRLLLLVLLVHQIQVVGEHYNVLWVGNALISTGVGCSWMGGIGEIESMINDDSSRTGVTVSCVQVIGGNYRLIDHWNDGRAASELQNPTGLTYHPGITHYDYAVFMGWQWTNGTIRLEDQQTAVLFADLALSVGTKPVFFVHWEPDTNINYLVIDSYNTLYAAYAPSGALLLPICQSHRPIIQEKSASFLYYSTPNVEPTTSATYLTMCISYGIFTGYSPVGYPGQEVPCNPSIQASIPEWAYIRNQAENALFSFGHKSIITVPTGIAISNDSIDEGVSAGTNFAIFEAVDRDGDSHTYTLVNGVGSADNARFFIRNDTLYTAELLDYETVPLAAIRVRATDSHGLIFEKQFLIKVNDKNDPPTDIVLSNTDINENEAAGTVVGSLGIVDPNGNSATAFELIDGQGDDNNALFTIEGISLKVRLNSITRQIMFLLYESRQPMMGCHLVR